MNTIDQVAETIFSSDEPKAERAYKRIYRGFPVLNSNITSTQPSHRIITYRGVTGVYSYI